MHSTGEKTNPGPLGMLKTSVISDKYINQTYMYPEAMLNSDPFVHGSMMFGRGRFYAGVLVQPKAQYEFDPTDMNKVADFRNLIWYADEVFLFAIS